MEKKRILIVDDSDEFSFLVVSILKFHEEIVVHNETSPINAAKLIKSESFDLFIIDFLMDDLSGIELIEKIRQSELNNTKKCILLTAKELNDDELAQVNKLNALYTRKPIMPNEFYKRIMDILNHD